MNFRSLSEFTSHLRRLPRVVAQMVAKEVAPELTKAAEKTFAASEDAYGNPWAPGHEGRRVTLRKSGKMFSRLYYVANGTKLRVALGVPYAKYQIGRRPVFPRQGGSLPLGYVSALQRVSVAVVRREMPR